jgi:hypothetical protein
MIQFITVANQSSSLDATCKDFERSKDQIFSTKYVSITLHSRCKSFIKKEFIKLVILVNYSTFHMSSKAKIPDNIQA